MPGPRVLVVDDDALVRWVTRKRLGQSGYAVQTADSGEAALERLAAAPCDLLLLDVRLPGIDGFEVLRRVRERWPALAVVMMSAHCPRDAAAAAVRQGAQGFLSKPFPLAALAETLERALELRPPEAEPAAAARAPSARR